MASAVLMDCSCVL